MKKFLLSALAAFFVAGTSAVHAESTAHGYQFGDESGQFGFIEFPISQHLTPTLVMRSFAETHVSAAEVVNGVYYSFEVYPDQFGGISAYSYVVRDAATFNKLRDDVIFFDEARRVVDMTFDYTTNTMFALVEDKSNTGEISTTSLNVIDLATGDCHRVGSAGDLKAINGNGKEVEEALITLAADAQGKLYAMGEYRQFYSLDKTTGAATKVSAAQHGIATAPQLQSMAFDPEGTLYWAQCHPDYGYFLTIDPATGVASYMAEDPNPDTKWKNEGSLLGANAQVTGLWFEKPLAGVVVAAPADVKADRVAGSANSFNITWTLPALDIKGEAVTPTGVAIYRLGTAEPIVTLPAGVSGYTVANVPNGDQTFVVRAIADGAEGLPGFTTVFSGADALMPVNDLTATLDGSTVTLTWTAPTATYNGGYTDYDNITYRVWRIKGNEEEILTSDCKETSYTDELTAPGTYFYAVEPISCGVVGYAKDSNEVTLEAKTSASIPYFTGFEDDQDGTQWTMSSINYGNTSYGWSTQLGYAYQRFEGKFAQHKTSGAAFSPDDYLFSPAIHFEPGNYQLDYKVNGSVSSDAHTYNVYLAAGASASADVIAEIESVVEHKFESGWLDAETSTFTVAEAGDYHLVFHVTTPTTYATLKLDNVSITAAPVPAATLPYACDFEEESDGDQWVITNTNPHVARTAGWVKATDKTSPHGSNIVQLFVYGVSEGEYDDWMVSPAISFDKVGSYTVTYAAYGKSYDTHKWAIRLGTDPADPTTFTQTVVQHDKAKFGNWQDYTAEFTVTEPGTYHIGLHGQGCDTGTRLNLDNIRVAANSWDGVESISADSERTPEGYYDLHGRRLNAPAAGVTIIRYSDGTAEKIVR